MQKLQEESPNVLLRVAAKACTEAGEARAEPVDRTVGVIAGLVFLTAKN